MAIELDDEMKEILNDFLVESNEMIEALDQRFVDLESDPHNTDLLNEIFRAMHSMKGSAGFLGFTRLVDVTHRAESVLNTLRQGEMAVTPDVITVILETVDLIKLLMSDIRESGEDQHVETEAMSHRLDQILAGHGPADSPGPAPGHQALLSQDPHGSPQVPAELLAHTQAGTQAVTPSGGVESEPPAGDPADGPKKLGELLVEDGAATPVQIAEALEQQESKPQLGEILVQSGVISQKTLEATLHKQGKPTPRAGEEERTIRVETKRLDSVMNLVGELVLGRNRLMKISSGLEEDHESSPKVKELGETLAQLNLVTTDLQLAVMRTRMLPIRKALAKLPRMVRDLSQKLKKHVRLDLLGEETELDKSVADEIGDPLVHLVRNAIDHGLEIPADRLKTGKLAEGVLRISASQEGNSIVIRIEDDGRGLPLDKIRAKALARGLVSEAELTCMNHREVINLIFLPGFSTAEEVTDVSGRGVGMDVVRTNIRKLNGTVEVDSSPGKGTQITIKLPLTIAIIQALMVEVEHSTFAIPLGSIVEAVKIGQEDIQTINGREVLHLRERVLPLLRLSHEFEILSDPKRDKMYVVVAGVGDRLIGVVVDRLKSQEEVVIKSMWDYLANIKGIAGATITGEGKVVLILDVAEILMNLKTPRLAGATA